MYEMNAMLGSNRSFSPNSVALIGSYGVGKEAAMTPILILSRCRLAFCIVIHSTW